jgi:hypothetical protein
LPGALGLEDSGVGVAVRETEPLVWPGPEARLEPDGVEDEPTGRMPRVRSVLPGSGASGGARTTLGLPPAASDRAAGGESPPPVTSAGSVIAAASAAPISAATAMIARLLLTLPLVLPIHSNVAIGGTLWNLNCRP